ncbi:MAG: putative acyl-CoA transferase/carnitine dehydratase [Ilumatobacteraceae bacterium]|nr:putative acyl-CoA transferase/carnitine dehydratase [Ilumatobacteraceae bacterium]
MSSSTGPLAGVRIIESSMLGPAAITTQLADLGAEVIKVEAPSGDYIRQMTWPIVEGVSLMHLHLNRGKKSITLDLRTPEAVQTYLDLVRDADVVIEAMRPGGLERRGLGYDKLREVNPAIVFCTISGYGMTGPYAELPSHGVAYDVWAGLVKPEITEEGFAAIPEHPSMGIHAGPLFGALGVLAGVIKARATGEGCRLEIAQSDAAAAMDWYRSESWKAYERPESEVTGNASDNYVRRAPGTAGMRDGVRYQFYEASDGNFVLLQASEREFWENFCKGVDRYELFEQNPGAKFADHAVGNVELRTQLKEIFLTRPAQAWVDLGLEINVPIINVNTPQTLKDDPQFQARFEWIPAERLGAEQQPSPIKYLDLDIPLPEKAPTAGQHTDEVLRDLLSLSDDDIAKLRESGALG